MSFITKRFGSQPVNASEPESTSRDSASNGSTEKAGTYTGDANTTGFNTDRKQSVPENELEAQAELKALRKKHLWDPNFPQDTLADLDEARHTHDLQVELNMVDALTENSPYPEVRAAVRNVSYCQYCLPYNMTLTSL